MADIAMERLADAGSGTHRRARVLAGLKTGDDAFRIATLACALAVLIILGGVLFSLVVGSLPAFQAFGLDFLWTQSWNPVTERFGALAAILRHRSHLVPRHAGRRSRRARHRDLPHRALSPVLEAADRHCDRAARGHPEHHLRHLGSVRLRALPAAIRAARADRDVQRRARPVRALRGSALRHRRAHRRAHPGDHGAALHHLHLTRRVRDGAAGVEGVGLRHRVHHLGSREECRAALHPRGCDRRRDAGAGPSARRDDGRDLRHRQRAPGFPRRSWLREQRSPPRSPTSSRRRWGISTRPL